MDRFSNDGRPFAVLHRVVDARSDVSDEPNASSIHYNKNTKHSIIIYIRTLLVHKATHDVTFFFK
jgi:hypothetical protein